MGMTPSAALAYGFIVEPRDLRRIAADYEDKVEGVLDFLVKAVKYDGDLAPAKAIWFKVGVRVDSWRLSQEEYVVVTAGEELHQSGWRIEQVSLPSVGVEEARLHYAANLLALDAEPSWLLKSDFS